MKIVDGHKAAEMEARVRQASDKGKAAGTGKPEAGRDGTEVSGKGDNITFSEKAKDMGTARKLLDEVPQVRKEKVEDLKGKIESGTYNIKGELVADGIIKASIVDKEL